MRGVRPVVSSTRRIMVPRLHTPRGRGFGDLTFNQQVQTVGQIVQSGAATTAALLVQVGAIGGPAGALIGAAAAALVEVGSLIAEQFQGCGQTCVISSQDANQVGDYLLQNLRAYVAAPYNPALQAAALNNYQTAWSALTKACSDPSLGAAGQRCISDRQAGACTWKASPGGWVADPSAAEGYTWKDWGAAGSGSTCWNYDIGFRDPIANDPRAASYSGSTLAGAGSSILSTLGINPSATIGGIPISNLLLPAALLIAAAVIA